MVVCGCCASKQSQVASKLLFVIFLCCLCFLNAYTLHLFLCVCFFFFFGVLFDVFA